MRVDTSGVIILTLPEEIGCLRDNLTQKLRGRFGLVATKLKWHILKFVNENIVGMTIYDVITSANLSLTIIYY